jgi:hypothetical protein
MNGIVVDEQCGFIPNISTEIASYKLINEILVAVNNKMPMGGYIFSFIHLFSIDLLQDMEIVIL